MNRHLQIELLSDACFSMPRSADATVDADFAMDRLGLPRIPGKTLHGLLRDTWLACQEYVDSGNVGYSLLGEQWSHGERAVIRIGDGLLRSDSRAWVEAARFREQKDSRVPLPVVRDAFLTRRTLTAVDRKRAAPKTETLRILRVAPKGTLFQARLQFTRELTAEEERVLKRLLSLTRHAGLDRNRGLGHIEISLMPQEEIGQSTLSGSFPGTGTLFLPLEIRLNAPCLVSDRQKESNSQSTLPFISGAALRGAVAAALPDQHKAQIENLVATGEVRFLNAYPAVASARSLPTAITWRRTKDASKVSDSDADPRDVIAEMMGDFTPHNEQAEEPAKQKQKVQRQRLKTIFYSRDGMPADSRIVANTHQVRDRPRGVTRKDGEDTVFVYHALEEDQVFFGAVAVPSEKPELYAAVRDALSSSLHLGRSSRAQYGGAPTLHIRQPATNANGIEPGTMLHVPHKGERFVVRFTSDAVIRDPITGQHDPYALPSVLEAHFGKKACMETIESAAGAGAAFVDTSTAFGYNRLWRTNLPEVPCVAAGSLAVLVATEAFTRDEVVELQSCAIGERTAEGKGCFILAPMPEEGEKLGLHAEKEFFRDEQTGLPSEEVIKAQLRIYQQESRVRAADEALKLVKGIDLGTIPVPSFLHRLRMLLRRDEWQEALKEYLSEKENAENRRLAVRVKLGRTSLLSELVPQKAETFETETPPLHLTLVGSELASELWRGARSNPETRLYRLNVLLRLLAKEGKRSGNGDKTAVTGGKQ